MSSQFRRRFCKANYLLLMQRAFVGVELVIKRVAPDVLHRIVFPLHYQVLPGGKPGWPQAKTVTHLESHSRKVS